MVFSGTFQIILMNEEEDVGDVEEVGLGEGECLAHEASHTPAQGGIEAFEMVGVLLFGLLMKLFGRDGVGVGFQAIRETQALLVVLGHLGPHVACGHNVPFARHPGDDLAGALALHKPQPDAVFLVSNERPHLV